MARSAHGRSGRAWAWAWAWAWVVAVVNAQVGSFPDLRGNYCRNRRPTQCCDGRYDECAVPILGTLCYCDEFCDRSRHPDCCPDFWQVCRGVRPPPELRGCTKDGVIIPSGQSHKFNCNLCTCEGSRLTCEEDLCMVDESLVEAVGRAAPPYGWTSTNYSTFWGHKAREGMLLRTGTFYPGGLTMRMYPILLRPDASLIPRDFDARQKREWAGRVSGVSDQGWCASSWAFSTLGVVQDRLSIESAGQERVQLAPQHLLSCDRRGQRGCRGGHVENAWQFLRRIGTVNEECFPYVSGTAGSIPPCPRGDSLATLRCAAPGTFQHQRRDFYRTEPPYRIAGREEDIQWEVMNNGPVQALMKVHRDFLLYRGGVYSHTGQGAFNPSGGGEEETVATHSVRIIGWGEDATPASSSPTKYWLVANSWGREWGEDGFFRIRRGVNESDIETFILAVRVQLGQYGQNRRLGGLRARGRGRRHPRPHHPRRHRTRRGH